MAAVAGPGQAAVLARALGRALELDMAAVAGPGRARVEARALVDRLAAALGKDGLPRHALVGRRALEQVDQLAWELGSVDRRAPGLGTVAEQFE
jgi:hypothetical protein